VIGENHIHIGTLFVFRRKKRKKQQNINQTRLCAIEARQDESIKRNNQLDAGGSQNIFSLKGMMERS